MALLLHKLVTAMYIFHFLVITILSTSAEPNIILIVMDDWGFNDVSWHGHTNTEMPYLNKFVTENALMIDTFYTYPLCSISRTALLTGRYPIRYGLQSSVIENGYPFGLSIFEHVLPQTLKSSAANYNTYMIGKWHLGFHREDMTPLNRGFDDFRGSLSPMINFFTYEYEVEDTDFNGYDLYINDQKISPDDTDSQYLTYWERDRFLELMEEIEASSHDSSPPFFVYLSMHASHSPHDAPSECTSIYDDTECIDRDYNDQVSELMQCSEHQVCQAQTSCADNVFETMFTKLQSMDNGNIWDNTLIIFLSDNGAPAWDTDNSPLRGAKKFLFEGGVRTPSFIAGGYLPSDRYGKIYGDGMTPLHITDLYPTIMSLAGIDYTIINDLDGMDQSDAILYGTISDDINYESREFLYNAEKKGCQNEFCGAYRYGPYKLIWISTDSDDQIYWYDFYAAKDGSRWNVDGTVNNEYNAYLNCGPIPEDVMTESVYDTDGNLIGELPCNDKPCLFNIIDDPCEYNDLSDNKMHGNIYNYMYYMMMAYYTDLQQMSLTEYYEGNIDNDGNPSNFADGFWQPWIRDYNQNDEIVDFEDLMFEYETENNILQDIKQSEYYKMAMKYKVLIKKEKQSKKDWTFNILSIDSSAKTISVWIMILMGVVIFIWSQCKYPKKYISNKYWISANDQNNEHTPLINNS